MRGHQFAVHHHVGAGGAKVGGGAFSFSRAAEQLALDGDGEVLVLAHALCRLAVQHGPTIANSPACTTRCLLAGEAVLYPQAVIRETLAIKNVAVLVAEIIVAVVSHLHHAIFHAEGIGEVVVEVVAGDFHIPAIEVFAIEQLAPFFLVWTVLGAAQKKTEKKE